MKRRAEREGTGRHVGSGKRGTGRRDGNGGGRVGRKGLAEAGWVDVALAQRAATLRLRLGKSVQPAHLESRPWPRAVSPAGLHQSQYVLARLVDYSPVPAVRSGPMGCDEKSACRAGSDE